MSEDSVKLQSDGTLAAAQPQNGGAAAAFPAEAYPCPHCGQMLGPGVRVCVVCRQTIDPAQIRLTVVQPRSAGGAAAAEKAPAKPKNTPFPWSILLALIAGMMVLSGVVEAKLGVTQAVRDFSYFGLLIPPATALWVIFDALKKRVPRPLQWGIGTMLLWPIVFPWYLARRQRLDTICPFVESGARALLRIIFLWLLINALAALFLASFLKPLLK